MSDWSEHDLITADGINHGKHKVEDCINAVVDRCEDGYMHCAWLWSGGTCEECVEQMEAWSDE